MGFGTIVYNVAAAAAGATNTDLTAAVDDDFSQRNNHYIFTENYRLLMAYAGGASLLRGRYQVPTWNAIGEFAIQQVNRSLAPPSNPQYDSYYPMPIKIPLNEEFQVQLSNNLGAATEVENVVLQIVTEDWNANLPRSSMPITIRATASPTLTLSTWLAGQALTLSQSLRGGVYAVIGARVVCPSCLAFRINFPRYRLYRGRKLRPGDICIATEGNVAPMTITNGRWFMGEWGRFHTFEMPTVQFFGVAAGAQTAQVFLDCLYIGEDPGLVMQGSGGGM